MAKYILSGTGADSEKSPEIVTYEFLRKRAFEQTPETIGMSVSRSDQVYGAIVDIALGGSNIASMVCFMDGTASLYFNVGGGKIGCGQHDSVRLRVEEFLRDLSEFLPLLTITRDFNVIPEEQHHIFYLFTKRGIYTYDLDVKTYQESRVSLTLFSLSQMLLTEIRKTCFTENE